MKKQKNKLLTNENRQVIGLPLWNDMIVSLSSSIIWTRRPLIPITLNSLTIINTQQYQIKRERASCEEIKQIKNE